MLHSPLICSADEPKLNGYQIKAAFIFNFLKFVEQKNSSAIAAANVFNICLLMKPEYDPYFATLSGRALKEKTIQTILISRYSDLTPCHAIYISNSFKHLKDEILLKLKRTGTLTIGESEDFCNVGGVINFFREAKTLRFEINTKNARDQGIVISPNLLKLARVTAT